MPVVTKLQFLASHIKPNSSGKLHVHRLFAARNAASTAANRKDDRPSEQQQGQKHERLVQGKEVTAFIERCMTSLGTDASHAKQLAATLVEADYRGHFSHGLNRLEMYVNDVSAKVCNTSGTPKITTEKASVARVDGNNLLGPVVGNFAMKLAIEKAKKSGVGMVSVGNSNHFGIAGWYSSLAMKEGMIGIAMCNTSPLCVPTRGKTLMTGTNAFTFGAPTGNRGSDGGVQVDSEGDTFRLDMATTTAAIGKVELAMRQEKSIPNTWGVDDHGRSCTDPSIVFHKGGLLPIGGEEAAGGYKGFGLNMMVEIFCGILGNASFGPHVRRWGAVDRPANLGQFFGAIDPRAFGDGFGERLAEFMTLLRESPASDAEKPVIMPGDRSRAHKQKIMSKLGGFIPYHENVIEMTRKVAKDLGVEPIKEQEKSAAGLRTGDF